MSKTFKDSKEKKALNEALKRKRGGPHKVKPKGMVVCPDCEGKPDAMCDNEGHCWICPTCEGIGEVPE